MNNTESDDRATRKPRGPVAGNMRAMPHKTAPVVFGLLAALALAGCTAAPTPEPTRTPEAVESTPAPVDAEPVAEDGCANPAEINLGSQGASITGDIVDLGAREFAQGAVGLDDSGKIVSYTVASGDVAQVIGERLCIRNGLMLSELNHTRMIYPDQVLRLNPNPDIRYIPYYSPWDAPAGFQQIPYQEAIEAMGRAADAGDVGTMRAIWADTLSGMFTDPADIDAIKQALDSGNLDVLREMFS